MWKVCFLAIFSLVFAIEPGIDDECARFCGKKYDDKKEQLAGVLNACHSGCRAFSMLQLTSSSKDATKMHSNCLTGCADSFQDERQKQGCDVGCQQQTVFTDGPVEIVMTEKDPMFPMIEEKMANTFDGVFGSSMNRYVPDSPMKLPELSSKWFQYFHQKFGRMLNRMQKMDDFGNMIRNQWQNSVQDTGDESEWQISQDTPFVRSKITFIDDGNAGGPIESNTYVSDGKDDVNSWFSCLTTRTGHLSSGGRLILGTILLLCAIYIIWLFMSILHKRQQQQQQRQFFDKSGGLLPISTIEPLNADLSKKLLVEAEKNTKSSFIPHMHDSPPPAYDEQLNKAEQIP